MKPHPSALPPRERVLLIHGWLGFPIELVPLGRALAEAGFEASYLRHYSLFGRFETAIEAGVREVRRDKRPVHLVGFSLGGLVARAIADACPDEVRSLLLIGAPNGGSPLADILSRFFPTPSLKRLCCTAEPLPDPGPHLPVGCIAGNRGGVLGTLLEDEIFAGPNDGRVSLESALDVRHDSEAVIDCTHFALRFHPKVMRHAVSFLRDGAF